MVTNITYCLLGHFLNFCRLYMSVTIWLNGNLEDNTWHVCFGDLCLICLMYDTQFARTEGGACGRRGHPALWPVERDRLPEYDTAMPLCHNWGAKTVREVGERLSAALQIHVPVSISARKGNTSSISITAASVSNNQTSSCLMAPLRQHSPCVLDWPPVCLSGNVDPNQLSMFSLVVLSSRLLTLWLLCRISTFNVGIFLFRNKEFNLWNRAIAQILFRYIY